MGAVVLVLAVTAMIFLVTTFIRRRATVPVTTPSRTTEPRPCLVGSAGPLSVHVLPRMGGHP